MKISRVRYWFVVIGFWSFVGALSPVPAYTVQWWVMVIAGVTLLTALFDTTKGKGDERE